eukprot:1816464-Amphidinium_carterae.1
MQTVDSRARTHAYHDTLIFPPLKVEVCEKFTEMKTELRYPTDFPTLTALPEEVEDYLRTMHEYFCGFWHTYEHAWEDCRLEQHNTTNTTEVCTEEQHQFEKAI